jgi:chorismate mutase/prephenate dehydratase
MAEPEKTRSSAASSEGDPELDELRRRIDAIDSAILERLNERARVVQEVGQLKQARRGPIYQASREREIVERLAALNAGPFPDSALGPVFREIISATRSLEGALEVAYFGPEGTFTHLAAREQFGALAELTSCATIPEVFAAVERGAARLGVVPVENTTEGVVTQTFDALPAFEGTICGEVQLRISHNLLSKSGRLEDVRRVASHPQPLAQCREWLDRTLPGIERVEATSTATAALRAAEDEGVAAIGSGIAGEVYSLQTLAAAIEDRRDNTTRFLVIGKQAPPPSGDDLSSVVFTLRKDESGVLHRLLEPFASCGVNLTAIQLRPIHGKPWEYLFFLDLEGHCSEPRVAQALEAAARIANSYRVLGSFARATRRRE